MESMAASSGIHCSLNGLISTKSSSVKHDSAYLARYVLKLIGSNLDCPTPYRDSLSRIFNL